MRSRPVFLPLGLFAFVAVLLHGAHLPVRAQETLTDTEPVMIVLLPQPVVDDTLVSLEQMAQLSGGSAALRNRLGKFDITEFALGAPSIGVTCDQVRFRLLLAGIEPSRFRLSGAKRSLIVESDDPVTLRKIVAAAEHVLRDKYPGDVSQVTMTPNKGILVPLVALDSAERVRLEGKVKAPPRLGRASVEVAVMVNGKTREVVPVSFEITADPVAAKDGLSVVRPAAWLWSNDAQDIVIKTRDNVKIVANVGPARLEALGEALQDGRVGQVIRVRNVESNRIVHGRVEANGAILVEY